MAKLTSTNNEEGFEIDKFLYYAQSRIVRSKQKCKTQRKLESS